MSKLKLQEEKDSIMSKLKSEEVVAFISKYRVSSMLTFGSFNNDTFTTESDIDIAIIGKDKINLDGVLEIELFLEKLLNRQIDIIDLRSKNLNIFVKINILNEGKIIYCNDENHNLEKFKDATDRIYKENENFFWFRRRDVLS